MSFEEIAKTDKTADPVSEDLEHAPQFVSDTFLKAVITKVRPPSLLGVIPALITLFGSVESAEGL